MLVQVMMRATRGSEHGEKMAKNGGHTLSGLQKVLS
jgi:hypothetical protein